jgi:hypothetical protein
MNALDFFIKKADRIEVDSYAGGSIGIDIILERNNYGRTRRAIDISKDKKGLVEASCYVDWGGDGLGAASILDDELQALIEFVPAFKTGQDQISQISSLLSSSANDTYKMIITTSSVELIWNCGTYDQYSCIVFRNQELRFEGAVPEQLKTEMREIANLICEKE